jgi:hypothetical protein
MMRAKQYKLQRSEALCHRHCLRLFPNRKEEEEEEEEEEKEEKKEEEENRLPHLHRNL